MFKRNIWRNCSAGIPIKVVFVEDWVLDFGAFEILLKRNWLCEDGTIQTKQILWMEKE